MFSSFENDLAIILGIGLFLQVLFMTYTFKINKQLENQNSLIYLLIQLCRKNGIESEKIDEIDNANEKERENRKK